MSILLAVPLLLFLAGPVTAQPTIGAAADRLVLQNRVAPGEGRPVPEVVLARGRESGRLIVITGGGLAVGWTLPLRCAGRGWTLYRVGFEGSGEEGTATFLVPGDVADAVALAQAPCRLYVLDEPVAVPPDLAAAVWATAGGPAPARDALVGQVMWVVDGLTIGVRLGDRVETVRYAGIVGRELAPPGEAGSSGVNRALVADRTVRLELDQESRDPAGRLLAYVHVGETMVNAELVRRGWAVTSSAGPNLRHHALLQKLEEDARRARVGVWRLVEEPGAGPPLDKAVAPVDERTCPDTHPIKAITLPKGNRKVYFPIDSRLLERVRPQGCYAHEIDAMLDGYVRGPR